MRILFVLSMMMVLSCQRYEKTSNGHGSAVEGSTGVVAQASARGDAPASQSAQTRMIIRNAELRLIVTDAVTVARNLSRLAESLGGYAADSRQWRDGEQDRAALTVRVPAGQLNHVLAEARKFAIRVESETISGQDVTEEFSDLGAQVVNLEAAEAELRQLLVTIRQRTQKAADVLEVYAQLSRVRGDIERLRGRMKYLSELSALATIRIELIPDAIAKPVVEPGWRPVAAVRAATRALTSTLQWAAETAIWLIICVIPILLLLAMPVLLGRAAVRRFRITS